MSAENDNKPLEEVKPEETKEVCRALSAHQRPVGNWEMGGISCYIRIFLLFGARLN